MNEKHFEAMADYVAEKRAHAARLPQDSDVLERSIEWAKADEAYRFSLYLCNKFGTNFDRARFDAWIEKKSKV
jgi:hypothetical protein